MERDKGLIVDLWNVFKDGAKLLYYAMLLLILFTIVYLGIYYVGLIDFIVLAAAIIFILRTLVRWINGRKKKADFYL